MKSHGFVVIATKRLLVVFFALETGVPFAVEREPFRFPE